MHRIVLKYFILLVFNMKALKFLFIFFSVTSCHDLPREASTDSLEIESKNTKTTTINRIYKPDSKTVALFNNLTNKLEDKTHFYQRTQQKEAVRLKQILEFEQWLHSAYDAVKKDLENQKIIYDADIICIGITANLFLANFLLDIPNFSKLSVDEQQEFIKNNRIDYKTQKDVEKNLIILNKFREDITAFQDDFLKNRVDDKMESTLLGGLEVKYYRLIISLNFVIRLFEGLRR
jgi:hypothetical protein